MDNDWLHPLCFNESDPGSSRLVQDPLRELENIYRSAHVGLCVLDSELRFLRVNDRLAEMNGIPAKAHIGRTIRELLPDYADVAERIKQEIVTTGEPVFDVELHGPTAAQPGVERFWIEHWMPISDDSGAVVGINIVVHEITKRKRAEEALRQSLNELKVIYEGIRDGLLIANSETRRFIKTNREMCRMLGYTENELLTMSVDEIHPASALASVFDEFQAGSLGRLDIAEDVPLIRKEGTVFYADVQLKKLTCEGRHCLMGFFHDTTRRKLMEDDTRRSRNELEIRVKQRTEKLLDTIKKLDERSLQLRRLSAQLATVEYRERKRLGQILHDGMQQMLIAASLQADLIKDSDNPAEQIDRLKKILSEAIETSHTLAAELNPPVLLRRDICAALEWLVEWKHEKYGLNVELAFYGKKQPLDEEIILTLFRAARELLFNIVKHAGVKEARMEMDQNESRVLMKVADGGKGFEPNQIDMAGRSVGMGLFGIQERLTYVGGRMEIDSAPGRGCRCNLIIPMDKKRMESRGVSDWTGMGI